MTVVAINIRLLRSLAPKRLDVEMRCSVAAPSTAWLPTAHRSVTQLPDFDRANRMNQHEDFEQKAIADPQQQDDLCYEKSHQ